MASKQEILFENDLDEFYYKLNDIDKVKDAYMALGRYDDEKASNDPSSSKYMATFERFEELYNLLSESDKREFEFWKDQNGYDW